MHSEAYNLLHIEDDEADALIVKETLGQTRNYNIRHVPTMREALKEVSNNNYNVVLLDLNLPDIAGIDNVRCIREESPDLPIVVVTSVDNENWAEDVLKAGAQEYVVKGYCNGPILNRIIQSSIFRKQIENRLYEQTHYDEGTGLPNSFFFRGMAKTAMAKAKRWNRQEAFMFIDMENMKQITKDHGKEFSQQLIIEIANRIKENLRESDFMAHYTNSSFSICLDNNQDHELKSRTITVAHKLLKVMEAPFSIKGRQVKVSVKIGMALYPDAGQDFNAMMKNVEVAMSFLRVNSNLQYCFAKNLQEKPIAATISKHASNLLY